MTNKEYALIALIEDIIFELSNDGLEDRAKIYEARLLSIVLNAPKFTTIEEAREGLGHGGL